MGSDKDIDDQVPQDEFLEEDAHEDFDDGADFVEEDWESYDDEYMEEDGDGDGGGASKNSNFNKIVIGVAVVVSVIVGGMQILGGGGAPQPAPSEASGQAFPGNDLAGIRPEERVASESQNTAHGGQPSSGLPAAPEEGSVNSPVLGSLGDNSQTAASQQETGDAPVPREVQGELPPMPAPIAQAGSEAESDGGRNEGLIPLPETDRANQPGELTQADDRSEFNLATGGDRQAASSDETALASPLAEGTREAGAPMTNTASGELARKLDAVLERMEIIEARMAEWAALDADISALQKRLASLEKQPRKQSAPSSPPVSRPARNGTPAAALERDQPASSPSASWVLKAAQPGQAMVAKKGENDIISVMVGETIAGIGRITSIAVQNGQWVVEGTDGKITQ